MIIIFCGQQLWFPPPPPLGAQAKASSSSFPEKKSEPSFPTSLTLAYRKWPHPP